jgi:hypothetical protein
VPGGPRTRSVPWNCPGLKFLIALDLKLDRPVSVRAIDDLGSGICRTLVISSGPKAITPSSFGRQFLSAGRRNQHSFRQHSACGSSQIAIADRRLEFTDMLIRASLCLDFGLCSGNIVLEELEYSALLIFLLLR